VEIFAGGDVRLFMAWLIQVVVYCIRGAARKACSCSTVNDTRSTDGKKIGEEKYTGSETPLQFIPPPAW
jgi:hypothetical protein